MESDLADGEVPVSRHFRILDARMVLSGPDPVIDPIDDAYERFRCGPFDGDDVGRVEVSGKPPRLEVNGRARPLLGELGATQQVYQAFLESALDRVASHLVLHAAALAAPGGDAFLIAAPAGFGKSTLTLLLASRGFRFLSDDFAPLELAEARVSPYPRRIALRPGDPHHVPRAFVEALGDEATPRLLGKLLLDVGLVLGEDALQPSPCPLRHVIVLTAGRPQETLIRPHSVLVLGVRLERAQELVRGLERVDGVEIEAQEKTPELWYGRVRLDHGRKPTGALERLLDRDAVVFLEKRWEESPDFDAPVEASPATRHETAMFLLAESLNRRGGGRLLARFGDSLPLLFTRLLAALREVSCWKVRAGGLEESAKRIEEIVSG